MYLSSNLGPRALTTVAQCPRPGHISQAVGPPMVRGLSFPGMLRRAVVITFTYGRDVQQRGYSNQCLPKTSALSFFDLSNGKGHRLTIRVVVIRISINVSQPVTDSRDIGGYDLVIGRCLRSFVVILKGIPIIQRHQIGPGVISGALFAIVGS